MPVVRAERCPQDHPCPCVQLCPGGAIGQEGFGAPTIDQEKCITCGVCVDYCPHGAFSENSQGYEERPPSGS